MSGMRGRKHTPETLAKMRAKKLGKKHTPESIAKMRASHTGHKATDATRAKLSALRKGKRVHTDASKEKLRQWNLGRVMPREAVEKMRAAKIGRKQSDVERRKHSIAAPKGSDSLLWRGGVNARNQALRQQARMLWEYRDWRRKVYLRDNFTCQGCGASGCVLNAHHIRRFTELLVQFELTTIEQIRACEPMWDVSNGVTLCLTCHNAVHHPRQEL